MITVSPQHRIFLAIDPVDFRQGIDGLVRLCQARLQQDPLRGHYFLFRNRRKTSLKILYYDSQGFCLLQKRLSTGRFNHWPSAGCPLVTLTSAQFHVLIDNGNPSQIDQAPAWRSLYPTETLGNHDASCFVPLPPFSPRRWLA